MLCSNISVFLSAIPPEKRKRTKRPTIVEEEKPPESEDAEKTEEGGAEAEPKEEPKEEIKEEPKAQPYKVTLNGNVPCAILLHHARKVYIKEERKEKGENAELLVTMDTPCTQLDLATMEGKVVGLGEEEKMKTIAMEMLEARSDYILVLRKVDEEGNKSFTSLCHAPSMADIQITE